MRSFTFGKIPAFALLIIFLGFVALIFAAYVSNSALNTTKTKASEPRCQSDPPGATNPNSSVYTWVASCSRVCNQNSDCPLNESDPGNVYPGNSAWCFLFEEGHRCLQLQVRSSSNQPTATLIPSAAPSDGVPTSIPVTQQPNPTSTSFTICPADKVGEACQETYQEGNKTCYKKGVCLRPGEGTACSWGEGSYCITPVPSQGVPGGTSPNPTTVPTTAVADSCNTSIKDIYFNTSSSVCSIEADTDRGVLGCAVRKGGEYPEDKCGTRLGIKSLGNGRYLHEFQCSNVTSDYTQVGAMNFATCGYAWQDKGIWRTLENKTPPTVESTQAPTAASGVRQPTERPNQVAPTISTSSTNSTNTTNSRAPTLTPVSQAQAKESVNVTISFTAQTNNCAGGTIKVLGVGYDMYKGSQSSAKLEGQSIDKPDYDLSSEFTISQAYREILPYAEQDLEYFFVPYMYIALNSDGSDARYFHSPKAVSGRFSAFQKDPNLSTQIIFDCETKKITN